MPTPRQGETKDNFMSRCIPMVMHEGKPQAQAIAICSSLWDNRGKKEEKGFRRERKPGWK